MPLLKNLNPQQKKAVVHNLGPLLVIAGAGTGKTQIITRRIARLIQNKDALPSEILALTFTDKAANEMQKRVDILVPYGFVDTWISTFHSFGDKVLRENALEIGLSPDFQILTRSQAKVFFREHLFEFPLKKYRPLGNPARFIDVLLTAFDRARDEDVSPLEYSNFALSLPENTSADKEEKDRQIEISACYGKYMDLQLEKVKLDFSSQVYLALKLLREHPSVLERYQKEFKFILVDEFQDTNFMQLKLLELLASGHKNIMVVCDDDQAIYRFRGAAFSNILNFMKIYPETEKISININYRSQKDILDKAYNLISHNNPDRLEIQASVDKHLIPNASKPLVPVSFYLFENVSLEADKVAEMVKERVSSGKAKYKEIAVLVRSNNDGDSFLRAFNVLGIPWRFSGNRGLYNQQEVRACISFLKLIANPDDSLSLHYLIREIYSFNPIDLLSITNYSKRNNRSIFHSLKNMNELSPHLDIKEGTLTEGKHIVKDIEHYVDLSREESTGRLLYLWLTEKGILSSLLKEDSLENEQKVRNIARFFETVREYEQLTREPRLQYFIEYLDMAIESGESPEIQEADLDVDAVNVLTIHKAKGLEFKTVFIVSLVEGKFPWPKRTPLLELPSNLFKDILPTGNYHIQEERRLFYVALTRAKEEVIFTAASDYGGKRLRKISRFVYETLDIPKEISPEKRKDALSLIENYGRPEKQAPFVLAPIPKDDVLPLSFYHIDDYSTCPLKYKFVHILKIPVVQHHSIIFGNALHKSAQRYNEQKQKGKKVFLKDLTDVFESEWRSEGFVSRQHEDLRFEDGKRILKDFYSREEKDGRIPYAVEREFKFILGKVLVRGRWDRVDLESGEAVIIDFKSSSINTQKDADKRAKNSLQMALYAYSYYKLFNRPPKRTELHFLESGLIGKSVKGGKDFEKVEAKIYEVEKGLRNREFKATPSYQACNWCVYNRICPYTILRLF